MYSSATLPPSTISHYCVAVSVVSPATDASVVPPDVSVVPPDVSVVPPDVSVVPPDVSVVPPDVSVVPTNRWVSSADAVVVVPVGSVGATLASDSVDGVWGGIPNAPSNPFLKASLPSWAPSAMPVMVSVIKPRRCKAVGSVGAKLASKSLCWGSKGIPYGPSGTRSPPVVSGIESRRCKAVASVDVSAVSPDRSVSPVDVVGMVLGSAVSPDRSVSTVDGVAEVLVGSVGATLASDSVDGVWGGIPNAPSNPFLKASLASWAPSAVPVMVSVIKPRCSTGTVRLNGSDYIKAQFKESE
jgi:hypothetical protein